MTGAIIAYGVYGVLSVFAVLMIIGQYRESRRNSNRFGRRNRTPTAV
ncbi:MAG: hypothetical protein LBF86_07780 [Helicobacteraceae bacterium]|nr:hypothetical protein [Helicobacteraceae bacterium]